MQYSARRSRTHVMRVRIGGRPPRGRPAEQCRIAAVLGPKHGAVPINDEVLKQLITRATLHALITEDSGCKQHEVKENILSLP